MTAVESETQNAGNRYFGVGEQQKGRPWACEHLVGRTEK